jgi:predicted nucleic-acid-binding protein
MIAVDTNVVVRLLTRDNEEQYQQAHHVFATETVFIPLTVALETKWVLRYAYNYQPTDIATALRKLFGLPNVECEEPLRIDTALDWHAAGLDFADALHVSASKDCQRFLTFDKKLIKKAAGKTSLAVTLP